VVEEEEHMEPVLVDLEQEAGVQAKLLEQVVEPSMLEQVDLEQQEVALPSSMLEEVVDLEQQEVALHSSMLEEVVDLEQVASEHPAALSREDLPVEEPASLSQEEGEEELDPLERREEAVP
jgi:hypothetical protein